MDEKTLVRFWSKVNKDGPIHPVLGTKCWVWTAGLRSKGYGEFHFPGFSALAHRSAWLFATGASPGDQCVLHRCDNPPCVNPEHLFLGDYTENNRDRQRKGRTVTPGLRGESHGMSKLSDFDVRNIRGLRSVGLRHYDLATMFGVSVSHISLLLRGRCRPNV